MKKTLLYVASLCLMAFELQAGGYQVSLQAQRQIAMGHVGTGLAWDASSIFFNPGGLSLTPRNDIIVGATAIFAGVSYVDPQSQRSYQTNNPVGTPFQLFASFGLGEKIPLKFGIGVYTPFGSGVSWPAGWKGEALLNQISLRSIAIQPTVSYKISEKLGIGAGFVYNFGGVMLKRSINAVSTGPDATIGQANLEGNGSGIGYNVGIHYQASPGFSVGLSYRSLINMKVKEGEANFTVSPAAIASGTFPANGQTNFEASLPLPQVVSLGLGFKPSDALTIGVDVNWVGWSAYKELKFDYAAPVAGSRQTISPRNYKDAIAVRLGAEYKLKPQIDVRAGVYYDMTPVNQGYMTPETPDADRIVFSTGLGYRINENFRLDASFAYVHGLEREQTASQVAAAGTQRDVLPGKYQLNAFCPGLGISYSF